MKSKHSEAQKLFKSILKYSTRKHAEEIVYCKDLPVSPTKKEKKEWIEHISKELEKHFDEPTIRTIRMECFCTEGGKLDENKKFIKKVYDASSSMEDFVNRMNEYGADWEFKDGFLYTKYFSCTCPMLEGVDTLPTKTWCYCTIGYNKQIFDYVFGCDVEIELLKSIKMGDEICLMKIDTRLLHQPADTPRQARNSKFET